MPEVTYGRLDEVLRSLGFSVSEPEMGTRVYQHAGTAARVILPVLPDRDLVFPHHLVGTRMILEAFGIADPPEFTSRLQKAG
jgi:hypothetical protein